MLRYSYLVLVLCAGLAFTGCSKCSESANAPAPEAAAPAPEADPAATPDAAAAPADPAEAPAQPAMEAAPGAATETGK